MKLKFLINQMQEIIENEIRFETQENILINLYQKVKKNEIL